MVDGVHRFEVAGVEGLVALRHEFEQVRGPAGGVSGGRHECSSWWPAVHEYYFESTQNLVCSQMFAILGT